MSQQRHPILLFLFICLTPTADVSGQDEPVRYTIQRVRSAINIDGKLDEPAWQAAKSVGDFRFAWWEQGKKEQTVAKLLWNDEFLYVSYRCEDAHISGEHTERDSAVYQDDCVELFTAPNPRDPRNYFNIEMNVRGAFLDQHHPEGPGKPVKVQWNATGIKIGVSVEGTLNDDSDSDRAWILEAAIPFASFQMVAHNTPPRDGDVWHLNLNRLGGKTNPQFSQWSPSKTPRPQFHAPDDFGRVVFSQQQVAENAFRVPLGQRQLFLDDVGIQSLSGLKRTMHSPRKLGAVIRPRYSDGNESSIQVRSGPQWDTERGVYRLWLLSKDCYESADGLHWTPTKNRPTAEMQNAVLDPHDPNPARRYKGLAMAGTTREPYISSDGLQWEKLNVPPIPSQDESNMSYDEVTRTFIATVKHSGPFGRTVWLSTSQDFENWTKPELIFHPDEQDQAEAKLVIQQRWMNPNLQKLFHNNPEVHNVQVYNMGVFRYEGLYVGLPAMFYSTGKVPNYPNTDGFHLIQLVCSRDLRSWARLGDRRPFIGPSPVGGGDFDLTQILPPSRPIIRGDELWFYYSGLKYRNTFEYVGEYPNGKAVHKSGLDLAIAAICLATLRRDGFISLDAEQSLGTLVTASFVPPSNKLMVNVDAPQGELHVELLDQSGSVVARSDPMKGDLRQEAVRWGDGSQPIATDRPIQLRITLRNAQLYSYWFE